VGGGNGTADHANRVLNAPPVDWRCHQQTHEIKRFRLLTLFAVEMPAARYRQMRAWRVSDHQIPSVSKHLLDWSL
jgi:hypothetical protein